LSIAELLERPFRNSFSNAVRTSPQATQMLPDVTQSIATIGEDPDGTLMISDVTAPANMAAPMHNARVAIVSIISFK
jgi:hypothetical protein